LREKCPPFRLRLDSAYPKLGLFLQDRTVLVPLEFVKTERGIDYYTLAPETGDIPIQHMFSFSVFTGDPSVIITEV
jgi:hypothetical protein